MSRHGLPGVGVFKYGFESERVRTTGLDTCIWISFAFTFVSLNCLIIFLLLQRLKLLQAIHFLSITHKMSLLFDRSQWKRYQWCEAGWGQEPWERSKASDEASAPTALSPAASLHSALNSLFVLLICHSFIAQECYRISLKYKTWLRNFSYIPYKKRKKVNLANIAYTSFILIKQKPQNKICFIFLLNTLTV